jgi:hypothetical protein
MSASVLFIGLLCAWALFSLLRFVHMYDPASVFQRWRRFDRLRLVPFGAFFAPQPPAIEYSLLVRDVLGDGELTPWTELPRLPPRSCWHVLWNPDKHSGKLRTALARRLLVAAARLGHTGSSTPPPQLLLCPEYVSVLRFVSDLPRLGVTRATQFAAVETQLPTRSCQRCVLSGLHEV